MTYDLIEEFKDIFKDNKVVLDTYKMDSGYYYLLKKDGSLERLIVENNEGDDYELYKYLKIRDFYSKYLDADKAIDTAYAEQIENKKYSMRKKIYSNNIYTIFFKNTSLQGLCDEKNCAEAIPIEIFKKGIDRYYESLRKLGSKKEEKMLLEDCYKQEEIISSKFRMLEAFSKVYDDFKCEDRAKSICIKIFLEESEEEYLRVSNYYVTLKLFNKNDNNIQFKDEIYGVNNYNFGLNSKKPFLELKSTPYKVSSLISKENIKILNNIYRWLYANGLRENFLKIPSKWEFNGIYDEKQRKENENLYFIKVNGNNKGVARIDDFQYKSNFTSSIRPFRVKDIIRKINEDFETNNIYKLELYTSSTWIINTKKEVNYIRDAYYDYENKIAKSSILPNWKKEFLKYYAGIFFELFQKENEDIFIKNLDKIGKVLIENELINDLEKIKNGIPYNSVNSMNLWIAYKKYFFREGEVDEEMKINNVQEECREIVLSNKKIETDEQYYYLIGQAAMYLLKQSKSSKLTQDITAPFIKAANIKNIKYELRFLYEKYNYNIYLNNNKFNNIFSQLLLQEPETNVKDNKDLILAGMLAKSMFYSNEKIEENGGKDNEENE